MTPTTLDLFTPRLHLRPPVESDGDAISAIVGDWEVARRLARMPHPYTPEDFRFFLEHIVPREPTWAIIIRQTRELVGVIGLAPHDDSQTAELGYYVAPSHWGHGLVTEAAQAVVRWAQDAKIYAKLTSRYHATKLEPEANLHHAMTTTIERLQLDGWQPESDANHGFVFLNRNGERRLLMITARDPEERGPQTFSPFR